MNPASVHPWDPPLAKGATIDKICKEAKKKKNFCIGMFTCLLNALGRQHTQGGGCCELACTSSSKDVFDPYSVPVSYKHFLSNPRV